MNSPVPGTHGRRFEACQMPEKSGLPSGRRGVGAFRLGVPSAFLGTPGVGSFSHWADAEHRHRHYRNQDKPQTTPHTVSFGIVQCLGAPRAPVQSDLNAPPAGTYLRSLIRQPCGVFTYRSS